MTAKFPESLKRDGFENQTHALDKLRERWCDHWQREAIRARKWVRFSMVGPFYSRPLPDSLRGLCCGAKTRAGTPCQRRDVSKQNGRCKLHGGASTGPRTEAGKAAVIANLPRFENSPHERQSPCAAGPSWAFGSVGHCAPRCYPSAKV